jgi:hypothetical protein
MGAILRDAAREFDAPVALLSVPHPGDEGPACRARASAAVTSPTGTHLGTLCILGEADRAPLSPAKLVRLQELAARAAAALTAELSAPRA